LKKINLNIRKVLTGLIILAVLSAVGFSFNGEQVNWYWSKAPYVALLLIAIAFIGSKLWLNIERKQYDKKVQLIQSEFGQRNIDMADNLLNKLSFREKEVLQKIGEGKSNKQIADDLFIEVSTVKTHINNIYKTLKISSRKEAAQLAENQVR